MHDTVKSYYLPDRYTKTERICIKSIVYITIFFFLALTYEVYRLKTTSYEFIHRFTHSDFYYTLIIFICLIILLYFVSKGFWIGHKYKLGNNLLCYIPLFTALIVFILIYWPDLYAPRLTKTGWGIIHLCGIILMYFIHLLIKNKKTFKNTAITKDNYAIDSDNRFSEKDIKYLYLLTLLGVITYSSFVIVDILSTFNILVYSIIYHSKSLANPFFDIILINYLIMICLFYFTLKGIIIGFKKHLRKLFIYRLLFIIPLLVIYFPNVLDNLQPVYWVLMDAFSLGFIICYLMYIPINE
ncbi:MAG TPA: hypothetical protein QF753_07575 [Victivallales bacterium]|nr:hypothetical protein [Victivallales bacterium]